MCHLSSTWLTSLACRQAFFVRVRPVVARHGVDASRHAVVTHGANTPESEGAAVETGIVGERNGLVDPVRRRSVDSVRAPVARRAGSWSEKERQLSGFLFITIDIYYVDCRLYNSLCRIVLK